MIIFLIGFMGSGKTTIGKKLAKKLNFEFLDLDAEITKKEQKTISEIFEIYGEDYFRKIEHQMLESILLKANTVIACGGGTPCFYNNMQLMNTSGFTVYIQMNPDAIYSRLKQANTKRPLLKNLSEEGLKQFIEIKLLERESTYLSSKLTTNGININIEHLAKTITEFHLS